MTQPNFDMLDIAIDQLLRARWCYNLERIEAAAWLVVQVARLLALEVKSSPEGIVEPGKLIPELGQVNKPFGHMLCTPVEVQTIPEQIGEAQELLRRAEEITKRGLWTTPVQAIAPLVNQIEELRDRTGV